MDQILYKSEGTTHFIWCSGTNTSNDNNDEHNNDSNSDNDDIFSLHRKPSNLGAPNDSTHACNTI